MKKFWDDLLPDWQKWDGKIGCAFSSQASWGGGAELTCQTILTILMNFGFLTFPDELTTGSSIMPHKKNPDVFELIRARSNKIKSLPNFRCLLNGTMCVVLYTFEQKEPNETFCLIS